MDWSLLLFILVVVFFVYRGFKKGLFKSLSKILSLLAGYVAAILYSGQFSTIVESYTQLHGILAFITASLILFVGAGIATSFLFRLLGKFWPDKEDRSTMSSFSGATLGLIIGVIVAIVVVWTFAFVRDTRDLKALDTAVETNKSIIEILANRVASKAVGTAMTLGDAKPEVTKISVALAESPADVVSQAQRLMNSKDLNRLLENPRSQAVLDRGDIKALQNLPEFQHLAKNTDMLSLAKSAGLLDQLNGNTQAVDTALASQITDIWGRVQRVKNDSRVQEILADPEFQQKIQSGNPLDLLTNAGLLELTDIIFSDDAAPKNKANNGSNGTPMEDESPAKLKQELKIYSWVDENGRVHYSDVEVKP